MVRREEYDVAVQLGRFGVWHQAHKWAPEVAAGLEQLGYGTLWIGGSPAADLRDAEVLLEATNSVVVGTSIVNMWNADPAEVAESYHRLEASHPGRFVLGVGIGHPEQSAVYSSPYTTIVEYLDALDAGKVPVQRRLLAALGPKVLKVAAERTAGAIPYLTTPDHTKAARELIGPGVLLAPEHKVVLETDDDIARSIGRPYVAKPYLGLTNYVSNLRRLGYSEEDLADGGSDRLIDDLVLHGTAVDIADGLTAHLEAGADHVVIQQLGKDGPDLLPGYEALAAVLF
ncbi:MAG TPA: LLM class F420-dependent oxidoreductase [Kribbella sp.]|nr:LLM class F420-dependent oxidoreductase [Kribbella sp.]